MKGTTKPKGFGIAATVLLAALFIAAVSVPAVGAQTTVLDASEIGTEEKEVISQLSETEDFSKNTEAAEKIRKEIEQEMEKEIDASVESSLQGETIQLTGGSVYLGTDKTFYDADTGDKGTSTWGLAPWFYESEYYLSTKKDEAASLVGPGGYGGAGAWCWVGKSFHVYGSGSQTANVMMPGHLWGLTTAFAGGSSNSNVDLVVKDVTTGTEYTTNVYSQSAGGVGWFEVDKDFNSGVTVNLQAGHDYVVYLEVQTSASVYGVGEAGSDFGPQDGDYSGEGAWYFSVTVDF